MRRIRVLFPFVGGPVLGGSHISALSLAAALDPNRFEARVLVHFEPGAIGLKARELGLDAWSDEVTAKREDEVDRR